MSEPVGEGSCSKKTKKTDASDPEVVLGHRVVQTRDVKWLCVPDIYQKLHRPNLYDIGGTYMHEVADYWFSFKSEQVGNIFLLHLFICNHTESCFTVALSCNSTLKVDKKNKIVYLQQYHKEFQFKKVPEMFHSYLTTYNFTDIDVELFKDKNLYIAVNFPCDTKGISLDVINRIKINHDCGALLTDPIDSDFTIESADGGKFKIHKVILAAHSEVFKAMLKEETAESQNSYVKLVDVNEEDLRGMLEYIYTGTVKDVENVNFANLLMLADRYNLQGLCELSQYALSEQLGLDNAFDILVISDMYDSDFLKNEALKFIKTNPEVLDCATFKEINSPALIRELCTYLAK